MDNTWPEIRTACGKLRGKVKRLAYVGFFSSFYLRHVIYGKYSERKARPGFWQKLKRFVPDGPSRWDPGLNFCPREGRALVLFHQGKDSEKARQAALNIQALLDSRPFSPVLITPMPDFHFYIRLGWLVEFLPEMGSYSESKLRYLCARYRSAVWLPLEAGLAPRDKLRELL